jgi:hypothetical protein
MPSHLELILRQHDAGDLAPLFSEHAIDDSLLADLTDADLERIGIDKLGLRKRLLAAFAELPPYVPPSPPVPRANPALATRQSPFINSLGHPLVPIPGYATLFGIWQVRVQDYQLYCHETAAPYPACDFAQEPGHPVVNVTWHDAAAFCKWLTQRELASGLLDDAFAYRLPADQEWSAAVGLIREVGRTPEQRSGKIKTYPWGVGFPPPAGAGNYHPALAVDPFKETAPVGSFAPNALGIHDLGGNVWEWCLDEHDRESDRRVLRGASCFNDDDEYLLSSYRDKNLPDHRRNNNGIRLALAAAATSEKDLWF